MSCLALMLLGVLSADSPAGSQTVSAAASRYYVTVFGVQNRSGGKAIPWRAHTFATWTEVGGDDTIRSFTISWVGTRGNHLFGEPDRGKNLDLRTTLVRAREADRRVTRWGPYETTAGLFRRAEQQHTGLRRAQENGSVLWKALDAATRHLPSGEGRAINCIHAVSDVTGAVLQTGSHCGDEASKCVVAHFAQLGFLDESRPDDGLWAAIDPRVVPVVRATEYAISEPLFSAAQ